MERKIIWEQWLDPFQPNENETEFADKTPYEELEEADNRPGNYKPVSIISSPILGVVPIMPHAVPSKTFNFWVGHTNFDIQNTELDIIEKTPGVETLDIVSRYRFRISIGKAFNTLEVKNDIKTRLQNPEENASTSINSEVINDINELKNRLSEHKYWFIFVTPNGKIDSAVSEEMNEDFQQKLAVYQQTKELVNGMLITSWE